MGGGLAIARHLQSRIADYCEHEHVVLFPTGWAAGYGGIKGIVRPRDAILIDALAHDCLQHGAHASTRNVTPFAHNDLGSLRKRLARVRDQMPDAGILVVTESLFSMDSDHPDFAALVEICRTYRANTLVDCAHDLGVLGPGGRGALAEAGITAEIDFLIGSFSKTFACIGGFFASQDRGSAGAVRAFSGSYTFSNFLVPAQVAAVSAAFELAAGEEGDALRLRTLANAHRLRERLGAHGMNCMGRLSPMVIVPIGPEVIARPAYRRCMENGIILNCIEFPAVRRGEARFRLQVTPNHSEAQLDNAADVIAEAVSWARERYGVGGE